MLNKLDYDYDYYRPTNWIYFDDSSGFNDMIDEEKIVFACKCSRISIDESNEVQSDRDIILLFRNWCIPERVSATCSRSLSVEGKELNPIHLFKDLFLDTKNIKYCTKPGYSGFIYCRDIYGYENFIDDNKDLLYMMKFNSISEHNTFKYKSSEGYNIKVGSGINERSLKVNIHLNDTSLGVNILDRFLASLKIDANGWFKIHKSSKTLQPYRIAKSKPIFPDALKTQTATYDFNSIISVTNDEITLLNKFKLNILVCNMDIECTSSTGIFPNEAITQDYITQISACFKSYKSDEIVDNYLITWLPTENSINEINFNDGIDEVRLGIQPYNLIVLSSEKEMIEYYFELCKYMSPDIIVGHNTYGFDNPYIHKRCKLLDIDENISEQLVKMNSKPFEYINFGNGKNGRVSYWQSTTAYIDTVVYYRGKAAAGGTKLDSYSLNYIATFFLKIGKDDVDPKDMFISFNESVKLRETYDFILTLNKNISQNYYDEFCNRYQIILNENKRIASYCVKDSVLVGKLLEYHNILEELIQVSCINCVDIVRLFSRGQQLRIFNRLYRLSYESDDDIPIYVSSVSANMYKAMFTGKGFPGAKVLTTVPGISEPVITIDFNSLYPSIIIDLNACYSTYLRYPLDYYGLTLDDVNMVNTPIKTYVESPDDVPEQYIYVKKKKPNTKICGYYITYHEVMFVKATIYEGILPRILKGLLHERYAIKGALKDMDYGSIEYILSNATQLGIKISSNSIYGYTGVSTDRGGKMTMYFISGAVTAKGQEMISVADKFCTERFNSLTTYGDTDSVMPVPLEWKYLYDYELEQDIIYINIKNSDINTWMDFFTCQKYIDSELDIVFPRPNKLEFEELSKIFLSENKKTYIKLFIVNPDVTVNENSIVITKYKEYAESLGIDIDKCNDPNILNRFKIPYKMAKHVSPNMRPTLGPDGYISLEKKHAKRSGVISIKRDTCRWNSRIFDHCMKLSLSGVPFIQVLDFYITEVYKLYNGKIDPTEFSFNKRIKGLDYSPVSSMHKIIQAFTKRGHNIQQMISNRYDMVTVKDPSVDAKGDRTYLIDEVEKLGLEIDFESEISKLDKQLGKFIGTIYAKDIAELISDIEYRLLCITTVELYNVLDNAIDQYYIYNILCRDYKAILPVSQKFMELRINGYKTKVSACISDNLTGYISLLNTNCTKMVNKLFRYMHNKKNSKSRCVYEMIKSYINVKSLRGF